MRAAAQLTARREETALGPGIPRGVNVPFDQTWVSDLCPQKSQDEEAAQ